MMQKHFAKTSSRFSRGRMIRNWVAASLSKGYSVEQLQVLLSQSGFSAEEIEKELALTAPYIAAIHNLRVETDQYKFDLRVREALLKALDSQLRHLPHYLKPEKVPLPPFKQFLEEYYYPNRLGFFSEALDTCEAKYWTTCNLVEKVGTDTLVEVQYGIDTDSHDQYADKYRKKIKFGEFVELVEDAEAGSHFYMMAVNYPANKMALEVLRKDIGNIGDGYLAPDAGQRRMNFFMGPKGTITSLHYDLINVLYLQVYGRKLIRLFPALQVPYIYNNNATYSDVDILNPDLNAYPDFAKATMIEIEVGPGDCLFIPIGWGHHITSLSPSISLSCSNINTPADFENKFIDRKEVYGY